MLAATFSFASEKAIVIYFSHTGENYAVGVISEGNTAKVAKLIAKATGAELYEIKEAVPYPENYKECVDLAKKEKQSKARPKFAGEAPDLSEYTTIYLGYPNWWGDAPMVVYTFLEAVDLKEKTVLPFCTHEGSGLGSTAKNLAAALPDTHVELKGLAIYGHTAQKDEDATKKAVNKWLEALKEE